MRSNALAEILFHGPSDRHIEALLLLVASFIVVACNILAIATLLIAPRDVLHYYLISLSVADLLSGVFIIPLSVYPALVHEWVYGDLLCRLSGFGHITLWSVHVYTFMWLSVDRYIAIRKPLRYDTIQTKTRCQCWVFFTWLTSVLMCLPPLLGFSKGQFYQDAYICVLDMTSIVPYCVTLALLILAPSIGTVVYSYTYIFVAFRKLRKRLSKEEKEYATAIGEHLSNPDHIMCFVLILVFWISWFPWLFLQLYERVQGEPVDIHALHFVFLWLGVLDCLWNFFIYVCLSPKFRLGLHLLCLSMCCRGRHASRALQVAV